MAYETILVETKTNVGIITLNRPKALNALNMRMAGEIGAALGALEADPAIGCIIITGSEKAFAAGADVKEMAGQMFGDPHMENFTKTLGAVAEVKKPVIAAVSGFCFGGACELAMACDFIIAADTAKFSQPEITLAIFPGAGGTQRLARSIGKAKAMDMILTGRMMDASEAERCGLVSRLVAADRLMDEALAAAQKIATYSQPSVRLAKEAVNRAFETSLSEGVLFERRSFLSLFATHDQKEGMKAFVEKRKPEFEHR